MIKHRLLIYCYLIEKLRGKLGDNISGKCIISRETMRFYLSRIYHIPCKLHCRIINEFESMGLIECLDKNNIRLNKTQNESVREFFS